MFHVASLVATFEQIPCRKKRTNRKRRNTTRLSHDVAVERVENALVGQPGATGDAKRMDFVLEWIRTSKKTHKHMYV